MRGNIYQVFLIAFFFVESVIMSRSRTSCFYHPNREAVDKCEKCNRLICLEDKMIYRTTGGQYSDGRKYVLCPICYNERERAAARARPFILICCGAFCIIFALFAIFMLITMLEIFGNIGDMGGFP